MIGPDDELAARRPRGTARAGGPGSRGRIGAGTAPSWPTAILVLRRGDARSRRCSPRERLALPGPHNLENALAAAAGAAALGRPAGGDRALARQLRAGCRIASSRSGTVRGVRFVNDSKATNTDSLAVALASFEEPVILIAGGRDKGQDFRPLRPAVGPRRPPWSSSSGRARSGWRSIGTASPSVRAGTLEEAVRLGSGAGAARAGGPSLASLRQL